MSPLSLLGENIVETRTYTWYCCRRQGDRKMFDELQQLEVFPTAVDLKRIDPSLNMRRFYRISVQPDLFGGVSLVREWGRIGYRGQMLVEQHDDEGRAVNALMKLSATKKRRGYRLLGER